MAQAMKCDRCGKFYTIENQINILHKRRIGGLSIETSKGNVIQYYDLCDSCISKLLKFMNIKPDDEKQQ